MILLFFFYSYNLTWKMKWKFLETLSPPLMAWWKTLVRQILMTGKEVNIKDSTHKLELKIEKKIIIKIKKKKFFIGYGGFTFNLHLCRENASWDVSLAEEFKDQQRRIVSSVLTSCHKGLSFLKSITFLSCFLLFFKFWEERDT